jgi:hypothetical protein
LAVTALAAVAGSTAALPIAATAAALATMGLRLNIGVRTPPLLLMLLKRLMVLQ